MAGRARLGASDRVGGSRRYKHCSVHCALLETMLQFGVAPPTNKVKGGQRHLQLLLLMSSVAAEARVLAEASVHPVPALQGSQPNRLSGLHAALLAREASQATQDHMARTGDRLDRHLDGVSRVQLGAAADSLEVMTNERRRNGASRVQTGNGVQQACGRDRVSDLGVSRPAPTAGSVSPKDGFSSITKSVDLHDATYGIAGNHRKPVRSLCNLRIPSFASAPLGVPDPVVASRRLHIGCALARLADARMLVGTCVKAANLGAVPPWASLPGSLSRSAGIDFVNACQRGLGIVGAGSRRKAESPRPSADSWLPWALRAPWAGYARPVDKRVQCCRSAAPGVGMACGQCRSA